MDLNKAKNKTYSKESLKAQNTLYEIQKFINASSSVYIDLVRSSGYKAYIDEVMQAKDNAEQCITMLIQDSQEPLNLEKNITSKLLDKIKKDLENKICSIEKTILYVTKSSKAYKNYILSTGITAYANSIEEKSTQAISELKIYLALYNDDYEDIMQKMYSKQKFIKTNSEQ